MEVLDGFRSCRCSLPSDQAIDAPAAGAVGREEQEDEAEQHGWFAVILDRPEALRLMELEVCDRHLAGKDEGDRPRPDPEHDRCAAVELEHSSDPDLREKTWMTTVLGGDTAEPVEEFHAARLEEQQAGDDSQQEERDLFCSL